MLATNLAASDWWAMTRPDAASWIANYKSSLHARHRNVIAEIIGPMAPESLIEVGCHCGPNLIRLAQDVPSLSELFGIDVSAQAIAGGNEWAKESGLSDRVKMQIGRIPKDTQGLTSGCADVVLSCYALAYLTVSELDDALYEMGRLAARAVVIAEPMTIEDGAHAPTYTTVMSGYQEFAYDYQARTRWINSLQGWSRRLVPVTPRVDQLNAVLVLERP